MSPRPPTAPSAIHDALAGFGPRVRRLRAERGWTLDALAAASGVSAPHLSRIESGERQPSLSAALSIAIGFGLSLQELIGLPGEDDAQVVVRGAEAPIYEADGVRVQLLNPAVGRQDLQAVRVIYEPGRQPGPGRTHDGQEWLYVLSGRLRLMLGGREIVLAAGDAAAFDGQTPHQITVEGDAGAEALLVHGVGPARPHTPSRHYALPLGQPRTHHQEEPHDV